MFNQHFLLFNKLFQETCFLYIFQLSVIASSVRDSWNAWRKQKSKSFTK